MADCSMPEGRQTQMRGRQMMLLFEEWPDPQQRQNACGFLSQR